MCKKINYIYFFFLWWWSCSLYETALETSALRWITSKLRVYGPRSEKEQINKGGTAVGAYYRLHDQGRRKMRISPGSLKQPQSHRHSFFWGTLSTLPSAGEAAQQSTSSLRGSFENTDDNFLSRVVEDPTRNGELLNFILTSSPFWRCEGCEGSLDCSDHENLELQIREGESRAATRTTTMNFRRADVGHFKDALGRIPWKHALQGREVQES